MSRTLGQIGFAGAAWMMLGTLIAKSGTFIAQVVLGIILSQGDFGIYASAIGVGAVVLGIQNGGAVRILVQKGPERWHNLAGSVFHVGSMINLSAILLLVGMALVLAWFPSNADSAIADDRLPWILVIIALSLVPSSTEAIYVSYLSTHLLFRELARLNTYKSLIQNALMILLALSGAGPFSFAIPIVVGAIFGAYYGLRVSKVSVWTLPTRYQLYWPILSSSKWLVVASFGSSLFHRGDYLSLGFFLSSSVLGLYFFAFQIVMQLHVILAFNLQQVLLPVLTEIAKDMDRFRSAFLQSLSLLMVVGSGLGFSLFLAIEALEAFIWKGKWSDAVILVQILSLSLPFRMVWSLVDSTLIANKMYKYYACLMTFVGLGLTFTAFLSGYFLSDIEMIVVIIAFYLSTVVSGAAMLTSRIAGVLGYDFMRYLLPPWILAMAAYAAVTLGLTPSSVSLDQSIIVAMLADLLTFALMYLVLLRIAWAHSLYSVEKLLPEKASQVFRKLLLLGDRKL